MFSGARGFFVFILAGLSACGPSGSGVREPGAASSAGDALSIPRISPAQLHLISSGDSATRRLGWASVTASIGKGAPLDRDQQEALVARAKADLTPEAVRTLYLAMKRDAAFRASALGEGGMIERIARAAGTPAAPGIEALAGEHEQGPLGDLIRDEQAQAMAASGGAPGFSYDDFLSNGEPSTDEAASPFVSPVGSDLPGIVSPAPAGMRLTLLSGTIDPGARTETVNTLHVGNQSSRLTNVLSPMGLERRTLGELLRGLTYPPIAAERELFGGASESEVAATPCAAYRIEVVSDFTANFPPGNSHYRGEGFATFVCQRGVRTSGETASHAPYSRYSIRTIGITDLMKTGRFVNTPPERSLEAAKQWFRALPSFQADIDHPVSPERHWVAVRARRDVFRGAVIPWNDAWLAQAGWYLRGLPDEAARVTCRSGCLFENPVARSADGWLLFASSGGPVLGLRAEGPAVLSSAAAIGGGHTLDLDIIEITDRTADGLAPSLAGDLPARIGDVGDDDWLAFLGLVSRSLKPGEWMNPELERADAFGLASLHRLGVLRELLEASTPPEAWAPWSRRLEVRLGVLSAHARTLVPRLTARIRAAEDARAPVRSLLVVLGDAVGRLSELSRERAYQLIGYSAETMQIDRPEAVLNKEELEEAVAGAFQLAAAADERYSITLRLLCRALLASRVSAATAGAAALPAPDERTVSACEEIVGEAAR